MLVPEHVGIIMDGNGRWASRRGWDRSRGHVEGLKAARVAARTAAEAGVKALSLYVFSTENWKRSTEEVGFLLGLVTKNLEKELDFYRELGLRIVHSGDREGLPAEVRRCLDRVASQTARHTGMTLNLALNYGGRDEMVRAVNRWTRSQEGTDSPRPCTASVLRQFFDEPDLPDLDLVVRTGGELRLSNFLLWQAAYAELVFSPKLWPDFSADDLMAAFREFATRGRRFGSLDGVEIPQSEGAFLN